MDIGIDWARNSQLDRLSPVQVAVYRWSPANPARLSRNGRRSGRAARSPVVVPIAISRAYWLWNRSWATVPWSNRIRSGEMAPVAGSFMSFQIPAMPEATCAALSSPHQSRVSCVAKSGNAVSPGHTWPRNTSPPSVRHSRSRSTASAYTGQSGSDFSPGSTIVISRAPRSARSADSAPGSGNFTGSQVKTRKPRM